MQQICAGAMAGSRPEPGLPRKANRPFSGIWKPATGARACNIWPALLQSGVGEVGEQGPDRVAPG